MRRIGVLMGTAADEPEAQGPLCGVRSGPAAIGLDRRPQRADRHPLGHGRCSRACARMRRNWSRSRPDVVLAGVGATTPAMQQVTRTLPIVFGQGLDPVGAGQVESLARPGGNTTGFLQLEYNLSGKWLELLKEIAPSVKRVARLAGTRRRRDRTVGRDCGRGGVVGRGAETDRCSARCRRGRTRHDCVRARFQWRPDRGGERGGADSSRPDRRTRGAASSAGGLLQPLSSSPTAV